MQQQHARKSAAVVDPSDQEGTAGVQAHVLNPKAITLAELYGSFNAVTNEWTDGLASRMIRAAVADSKDTMHWVVFDGPVDAGWVESMNTGVQP
jgi:dynein heavy chain